MREAMREIDLDLGEGADMILMKPAMPYLDVIRAARERFEVPIGAYQVSGEYSMLQAAFAKGWLEPERAMMESLISIRRAGAGFIVTYLRRTRRGRWPELCNLWNCDCYFRSNSANISLNTTRIGVPVIESTPSSGS